MHYDFDTSIYPVDQRVGVWSDHLARICGPHDIAAFPSQSFYGRVKINLREQFGVSKANLGGIVETRTRKDAAGVPSEDLWLMRPLAGAMWLEQGGTERSLEPRQICLRNLGVPQRTAVVALECMYYKIQTAPLQQRLRVLEPFYQITKAADPMRFNLVASFLDYFGGNLDQWNEDEFAQLSIYLYDLIALLILKPNSSHAEGEVSVRIARREHALAYIRAHLADPNIKPASVAEACGISVRYLYEIFKMANLGVEECILDERVERSRVMLNDARYRHLPVSVISQMVGFKDPSHFVRSFRRRFDVTPGNFRNDVSR
jgi:AraC-like DNA-binding protein